MVQTELLKPQYLGENYQSSTTLLLLHLLLLLLLLLLLANDRTVALVFLTVPH